jgi:hypothetical protein
MIVFNLHNPLAGVAPVSNRIVPIEIKVNALSLCLVLQNVEAVAEAQGVSLNSIRNWFADKVLPSLPEALAKEKPGPKPKVAPTSMPPAKVKRAASRAEVDERPEYCPHCQSARVWKNGVYWVINWLAFLSMRWFSQKRAAIQRLRCGTCGVCTDHRPGVFGLSRGVRGIFSGGQLVGHDTVDAGYPRFGYGSCHSAARKQYPGATPPGSKPQDAPLVMLLAAVAGGMLAGALGALLSTPVIATLRLWLGYIYRKTAALDS